MFKECKFSIHCYYSYISNWRVGNQDMKTIELPKNIDQCVF